MIPLKREARSVLKYSALISDRMLCKSLEAASVAVACSGCLMILIRSTTMLLDVDPTELRLIELDEVAEYLLFGVLFLGVFLDGSSL